MTLEQAETYPGELEVLRGLVKGLKTASDAGDIKDMGFLLDEHERRESAALAALPFVPKVGPLYTMPSVPDAPVHCCRVLDAGLWWLRRNFGDDEIGRSRAAKESFNVHAKEGRDVCTVGRLVVYTLNIFEPPTAAEVEAVRKFYAGHLPQSHRALDREIAEYRERAIRAGLALSVRRSNDLAEWPDESYED